jgi:tubulin-specific chaperone E
METETECEYRLGMRVCDSEGYKGTIKYIGPVITAKNPEDTWLGIEWDNPTRGKHDGSCVDANNVLHRYFVCQSTAGSFVKPNKISKGVTFIEALHEKYVGLDAPQIAPDDVFPEAFVATSKGVLKNIEFVGEQKIRFGLLFSSLDLT